ncbi:hypothetical protein SAMN07250955_105269 [Arboricoccus pini]|uniref:Uncharacterized protein n=1 Tax=Arboricoccus pini TaxID=1963835 RepID=A0A212R521_9PROT|nr:hypothetical protein [Arboricoccus pini]SNB67159.1 hypothetical protein SAMN07250955_105269 [Arboricoccus pini]
MPYQDLRIFFLVELGRTLPGNLGLHKTGYDLILLLGGGFLSVTASATFADQSCVSLA